MTTRDWMEETGILADIDTPVKIAVRKENGSLGFFLTQIAESPGINSTHVLVYKGDEIRSVEWDRVVPKKAASL